MPMVAIREGFVLAIGCVIAWAAVTFVGYARVLANPIATMLLPIGFCLARAAMAGRPNIDHSQIRQTARQLAIAVALIFLFLFETAMGWFMGANGIPLWVWGVVVGFGCVYVLMFCVAHAIDHKPVNTHATMLVDEFVGSTASVATTPTNNAVNRSGEVNRI